MVYQTNRAYDVRFSWNDLMATWSFFNRFAFKRNANMATI